MKSRPRIHRSLLALVVLASMVACQNPGPSETSWRTALRHDQDGTVLEGSVEDLVTAIRSGCDLKVGWGARRAADPSRTIEHLATPHWVAVRDGQSVEVQLETFLINLPVLGEENQKHPRRQEFGGTETAVQWRANLTTDGSFDAVWYRESSGDFVFRAPQKHPMNWFVRCGELRTDSLYPE